MLSSRPHGSINSAVLALVGGMMVFRLLMPEWFPLPEGRGYGSEKNTG